VLVSPFSRIALARATRVVTERPPPLPTLLEELTGSMRRLLGWQRRGLLPDLDACIFPGRGNGHETAAARGGVSGALEAGSGDAEAACRQGLAHGGLVRAVQLGAAGMGMEVRRCRPARAAHLGADLASLRPDLRR